MAPVEGVMFPMTPVLADVFTAGFCKHPGGAYSLCRQANQPLRELPPFAALLRDIYGNPFAAVALAPGWRSTAVVGMAQVVYAERGFDRLPVLADALEEAGCTDAAILAHCRGPGPTSAAAGSRTSCPAMRDGGHFLCVRSAAEVGCKS